MARPRTIKGSGPSVPTGPFRVSPEQRAALETWARRRRLLDKAGEPELGAAFRDLLDLADIIVRADFELGQADEGSVSTVLLDGLHDVVEDPDAQALLANLAEQLLPEPRTPPSHSATPADPAPETKSP